MKDIGHVASSINFHKSSFVAEPFYILNFERDVLNQSVPTGIFQVQPRLEKAMEQHIRQSSFCTLKRGCLAEALESEGASNVLTYTDEFGQQRKIRSQWLVGADGKKGIVRKQFLERQAGIRQADGVFHYEGTWIAANLKIHLPNPDTHPDLSFWKLGLTPQQVYDLYWPEGWHFCSPPGKATATGRFGPYKERLWRHEFAEEEWNDSKDPDALLWEHITPMITRSNDAQGNRFSGGDTTYPRDCIEIRRNRPYTFVHKVVNKWFDGNRVLIGDAAHVYPPFGGQGIASGVRDAHQLAWRLAIIINNPTINWPATEKVLKAWEIERRQSIDDAARQTMMNGKLCNEPESLGFFLFRHLEWAKKMIPFLPQGPDPQSEAEESGFRKTAGGFFIAELGGGGKLSQIYIKDAGGKPRLSDRILRHEQAAMTLLVIGEDGKRLEGEIRTAIRAAGLPPTILGEDSVVQFHPSAATFQKDGNVVHAVKKEELRPHQAPKGYSEKGFTDRLGSGAKMAILRPDFYVFARMEMVAELEFALRELRRMLGQSETTCNL